MPVCALFLAFGLAAPPADADRAALTAAGVKPDDPAAVLGYLRKRSLGAADLQRLKTAIDGLGATAFADREAAGKAVVGFGPAAAGLLRQAVQENPDPEVKHRASECLRELDRVSHAQVAGAAVRAAVRLAPRDGAAVLLGFLPLADDRAVAAEVRAGLVTLAVRDGAADPAVVAALTDPVAARRSAAAVALADGGPAGKPVRLPAILPQVLKAAAAEPDLDARFQMLFTLATAARQKEAVEPLVELLPRLPRGRQWQVEDFLVQLAGGNGPAGPFGRYTVGDTVDRWLRWWLASGVDLAAVKYAPRTTGGLLVVTMPATADATLVAELGPDLDERWRLPRLAMLADVRPLPGGLVHVGERTRANDGYRVSVYDPAAGKPVRSRLFPMKVPNRLDVAYTQAHPLAGGGVLLVGPTEVAEYAAGKDQPVFTHSRAKMDVVSACRLTDGRTLLVVKTGPNHGLFLDAAGAEIPDKTLPVGDPQFFPSMPVVPVGTDRVLLAEPNRLVEYDLATGAVAWQKPTTDRGAGLRLTHGVERLPNGNTLYVEGGTGSGKVVEVTPDGDEVWTYTPPGSQVGLFRAFQR